MRRVLIYELNDPAYVAGISTHLSKGPEIMNWDRIQANWREFKGKVKEQWGKITDDELDQIAGQREQLAAKIQKYYGISKDEAERRLRDWERSLDSSERPL